MHLVVGPEAHSEKSAPGSTGEVWFMPQRRPAISVEPRPDGRWAVQKDGTKRASRVMNRKQDAVARARQQTRREQAELVIKDGGAASRARTATGTTLGTRRGSHELLGV